VKFKKNIVIVERKFKTEVMKISNLFWLYFFVDKKYTTFKYNKKLLIQF